MNKISEGKEEGEGRVCGDTAVPKPFSRSSNAVKTLLVLVGLYFILFFF